MAAVLAGLGGWLPPKRVSNADIAAHLDTTAEWIETRTGILERRMVASGMATRDLAVAAGKRAIRSAAGGVDALVVATTSPDRLCPAVAPEVAALLGLGNIPAFDINSACSGFVYGMATAKGLVESGIAERVLLIGSEAFSTFVNPQDRVTRPIFGDGAGAVVLRKGNLSEPGALGRFELGSDGSLSDLLCIPSGGSRQRSVTGAVTSDEASATWYLHMEGRSVFEQAVNRLVGTVLCLLEKEQMAVEDIDWFVGHQANARILQMVAEELQIDPRKVALNIQNTGNTLTASIPLLLCEMVATRQISAGQRIVAAAFGAGLSWGATTFTWPELQVEFFT